MAAQHSIELTIPRLAGTRARAELLIEMLPADLSTVSVLVDCSETLSAAQGFTDELCRQILELRGARSLILQNPPLSMAEYAQSSASLRGLTGLEIELDS